MGWIKKAINQKQAEEIFTKKIKVEIDKLHAILTKKIKRDTN